MANGGNVSLAGLEFEITTQADDALQHLESLASAFTKLVEPLAECAKSASGLATGLKTMNAALGKLDMSKIQEQATGAAKGIRELSEATQGRADSAAIADIANQLKQMRSESTATAKAISDIAKGFSDTGNSAS
ncbi:MAG: hypothetical protein J6X53_02675, partial [Abditibacteriota bacterium]|nr:hypothetical protein [Abditibacteriota bacterium]